MTQKKKRTRIMWAIEIKGLPKKWLAARRYYAIKECEAASNLPWHDLERYYGYRCIKVKVTEV